MHMGRGDELRRPCLVLGPARCKAVLVPVAGERSKVERNHIYFSAEHLIVSMPRGHVLEEIRPRLLHRVLWEKQIHESFEENCVMGIPLWSGRREWWFHLATAFGVVIPRSTMYHKLMLQRGSILIFKLIMLPDVYG